MEMDFAAMKRRELQALCKRHGLAAGGTNSDLVDRLTATLSGSDGAAAEAVGVVVGKGCLKRSAGGDSDAAKKVTFELEEGEETEVGVTRSGRRRSQVMSSPAVAKTRGRAEAPSAAKGDGGARRRTRSQSGGESADESDSGEAGADAKTTVRGKARPRHTCSQAGVDSADESDSGEAGADAKTNGRGKAPPAAKGSGGERRRTRSQAGGDSADEGDSAVEAGADAPVRRTRRNAVNPGAGDGAERIAEAVTQNNSARVEQEVVDLGDAVGRKHQLKRKTRENDIEDVDGSGQVGVSRRSTRSSSLLLESDALLSPVEKKRGRRKAADVKEKTSVKEQPTEALHSGRTLRSGVVVVAPVPPIVSESKKSRREVQEKEPAVEKVAVEKVQENEPAVEKVAEVEVSRRTTRSSAVAAPLTAPSVIANKRGRKTDDVHLDGGPDKKMENKRQSSRLTTSSNIHHVPSTGEEASLEQVAAPSKGLPPIPPRRSRRNPSEANVVLTSNTTSESSSAPTEGDGLKIARPTMLNAAKDGVVDGVEKLEEHVGLKKSKLRKGSATVATGGSEISFSDNSGKASATDMQIEVPGPVRRLTRQSVVPSSLEHETNDMHEDVEKKQTVTKPAGRSTRRSVAPVILEEESKGLTKEIVSEDVDKKQTVTKPAGRSTRRSVAPVILEKESKGLTKEIVSEDVDKKQTVTKPVGRSTRRSVAPVILEKESKGLTKEMFPEAHVKRPTRKSVVPAMLEKGRKSIITEIIPEAHVKRSTRKPALPIVTSENNDHCEVVSTDNLQSGKSEELEKQPTVKQPVRRLTRKSAVPAMLEKDGKGVPDMLNNEIGDSTEMQSDQVGHLEKQIVVEEHVRRSTGKSVVPDVIEKANKSLHEELKPEVSVRTPVCKSVVPNVVNKEDKDRKEFVRREELSVKTRSMHTSPQVALQNDESTRRTTRQSSKFVLSPAQTKPTASKGRPAKRRRTASLQESMPVEEQKEDHKNDVIEVATSTDLEIAVLPVTVEKSDLQDSQLNSELEGMVVVEFELEGTVGTTEKAPSNLPTPDCQHVGALSVEAVHSIENDAGRCSPNFEQSPTGLQFLFSQGITERSATRNAIPCPGYRVVESDVHKVECSVETVVSSKSDSYQGSDENSVSVEESGGCAFSSQQNDEQGVLVSGCPKDSVVSAQFDQSEDADHALRDVITKDLLCKEEEKKDFIPSADINVPDEISPANEPAENASGVSGAVFHISQSTPISDEVNSDSSRLESPDALNNRIASSSTEEVQQDNQEEHNLHNGVTPGIHASGMSEAAQVEVSKSGKMLLPAVETSAFRDAQLNRQGEGTEFKAHGFSCGNDGSGKNKVSQLANEYVVDSCQEQELKLPHDLSGVKSRKVFTTCQDEFAIGSGIGQSIVKGNNIAMDALDTAMNKEDTPAYESDAPELSSDYLLAMDSSVRAVQSVSGSLRKAGLAVDNPDNKLHMEQVPQVDVQVLQGIIENTALGSATPESNQQRRLSEEAEPQSPFGLRSLLLQNDREVQKGTLEKTAILSATPVFKREYGLPDKAEPHSLRNAICSSSVEHSPFGLQSLFPSDDVHVEEGTLEKAALGSVTPEGKHECGLPDKAEPHSLKEIYSSSVEQSPFGLQSLFMQDDAQVQEGILEKAAQCSVTPEGKHECGLPDEAEPHSSKNERYSTSVEQSPFGLESLFSQESIEEPSENVALAVHATNGVDDSKDIHVEYGVEKPPVPESVSDHDSSADSKSEDCVYTSEGGNEFEGLTKSCHEQEQMACQLDLLEAANCMKDFTNPEQVSYNEENKEPVHSTDISSSCEKIDANEPGKHASGLGDGLLSSSLVASTDDTDVHPSSNSKQFESTDLLGEPKGCSSTEALQQGPKEQCDEPKEYQVNYGACPSDMIEADTAKDLDSEVPPLPAKEASNMLEYLFLRESSKEFPSAENKDDSNSCHVEQQVEKMVSSEPDSSKGSDMHGDLVLPSAEDIEDDTAKDLDSEVSPLPAKETSNMLEYSFLRESSKGFPSAENEDDSNSCHVEQQVEKMVSSEPESSKGSDMHGDLVLPSAEDKDDSIACHVELEVEKIVFSKPDSSKGSDMHGDLVLPSAENKDDSITCHVELQVQKMVSSEPDSQQGCHEDLTLAEGIRGCMLSSHSQLEHEKDEQLIAPLLAAELSALPDEQANPELEVVEFEKCNFSNEDTKLENEKNDQLIAPPLAAETSALQDEQANPKLEAGEFEKCNFSSEGTSGKFGTGYLKNNLFQLHKDSYMDLIQATEPPNDLPAPKSPEQSTFFEDAETSALLDEQPNPELEVAGIKECNLSSEDISDIFGTGYVKTSPFQSHEDSHMDSIQGKELPNDQPAPKSPEQSTIGQDAKTSAFLDEQPNPELEAAEFEVRSLTTEDASGTCGTGYEKSNLFQLHGDYPIQGNNLPVDLPAPKSREKSTIGQDAETLAWLDEQPNPELEAGEFEERNFSREDTSGIFGTEYDQDSFQLHEYSRAEPIEGEEQNLSCDKPASYIFSSGSVENNTCHWDEKEEYNKYNDDQATAAMLSSGMTKPTLIEGSETGTALLSATGTSASTDDQLISKLEDDKEQNFCFDTDTSNICVTGFMENTNLFSLPGDTHTVTCYEHELPIGTPAAKCAGESAVCLDGSIPESVGVCQTSGRRRVDSEISTKLLRFKISSTIKGSYIAMDSAKKKQGDNRSPISLLGNMENVPAANADDPTELNTDLPVAEDSSRQGTTDGL